ncbi:MAG TPA: alpha/beta hydrolase family protein [Actinomycetota bacterium]|nr:alpha/beta hydrolase family protein [Actinomycetota bacterium]
MKKLALLAVLLLAPLLPAAPARSAALELVGDEVLSADGRLHELTLASPALERQTKVRVLLPAAYGADGRRFPVFFLLHGAGDNHARWTNVTDVEELTADKNLIVVMPDGGSGSNSGWYSDGVAGPAWATYHIGELLPFIDSHYDTVGTREGRAIAGLSIGGFGAMSYAARHPDLFGVAGSFSGLVDSTLAGPAQAAAYAALNERYGTPDNRVWGDYSTNELTWREHNPPDLSTNLRNTVLSLATGNGVPMPNDPPLSVPAEAALYPMNQSLHADLTLEGKNHVWRDRGYGTHEWNYWQADLHAFVNDVLMPALDRPPARPPWFSYRSARDSFAVWGWSFQAQRQAREFVDVTDASAGGLTARGSGSLRVTTPGLYTPGAEYEVQSDWSKVGGSHESSAGPVVADASGRLTYTVDLGPPHKFQQYTREAVLDEALAGPDHWRTVKVTIVRPVP